MSELEFEKGNEELFGMVNDHATPESVAEAEKIAAEEEQKAAMEQEQDWIRKGRELMRVQRRKQNCRLICKVLTCVLVAVLFVAALLDTIWVPVTCYIGLAVCISIGSILIDRHRRGH